MTERKINPSFLRMTKQFCYQLPVPVTKWTVSAIPISIFFLIFRSTHQPANVRPKRPRSPHILHKKFKKYQPFATSPNSLPVSALLLIQHCCSDVTCSWHQEQQNSTEKAKILKPMVWYIAGVIAISPVPALPKWWGGWYASACRKKVSGTLAKR
jgi:hypothetical protein